MQKKDIQYPAELTFKSVFKNRTDVLVEIEESLSVAGIKGSIMYKESSNSKFVSYTIRAVFTSDTELQETCLRISTIEGFMMMF